MTQDGSDTNTRSSDREDSFLETQYNRLAEDWRHYNNLIWQLPTVAITICAAIIGVAYTAIDDDVWYSRVALLVVGTLFLLMILVESLKLRLFHNMRTSHLHYIESHRKNKQHHILPIQCLTDPELYLDDENPAVVRRGNKVERVLYIDPKETVTGVVSEAPDSRWERFKRWWYGQTAFKWQVGAMLLVIVAMLCLVVIEFVRGVRGT